MHIFAAKAKEEAGNVCFQMKNYDDCGKYCDQASDIYMLEGVPDTAALCLKRNGRKLEFTHPHISDNGLSVTILKIK